MAVGAIAGAGCGRLGFVDADDAAVAPADTVAADGGDPCADEKVVLGTWSTPVLMVGLDSPSADEDATMSVDRREIFLVSGRSGNAEIWRATRPMASGAWNPPTIVTELKDPAVESTPELSRDGLSMWFASTRAGSTGADDVWLTTRTSIGGTWTAPVRVAELSSPVVDRGFALFQDERAMLLHSNRSGTLGTNDLFLSTRATTTDPWSTPVGLGTPPNTSETEQHGWMTNCGLYLVFHSTPTGGADLFITTRPSIDAAFASPTPISELNIANEDDKDFKLSADRRYGYFASTRDGDLDLYEVTR